MTYSTVVHPDSIKQSCSTCPHFNNFHESTGRGWCELFDRQAKANHQQTNDCVISSDLAISHELEDNLSIFSNISLEELETFPTEEPESELGKPHSEYQVGSIVKVIDPDEHHQEWAVFEIVDRKHNKSLYRSTDSYLNQAEWYFRLRSNDDASAISQSLWVREDEICFFDMSHNISTANIF